MKLINFSLIELNKKLLAFKALTDRIKLAMDKLRRKDHRLVQVLCTMESQPRRSWILLNKKEDIKYSSTIESIRNKQKRLFQERSRDHILDKDKMQIEREFPFLL